MTDGADRTTPQFSPLRPAPRGRLIAVFVVGPLLWLLALVVVAVVLSRSRAIEIGLLVTAASFVVSLIVLIVLRARRRHQERRYATRA